MGEINITGTADILKYLTPSSKLNDADLAALKYLVLKYPYSQPLQFAYLSALKQHEKSEFDVALPKIALHAPNRALLYRFVQEPQNFLELGLEIANEAPTAVIATEEIIPVAAETPSDATERNHENTIEEVTEIISEEFSTQDAPVPEINVVVEAAPAVETIIPEAEIPTPIVEEETVEEEESSEIPRVEESVKKEETVEKESIALPESEVNLEDAARIAAKDFFTFDQSTLDPLRGTAEEVETKENTAPETHENAEVTKFHDDTMPYTFLWWLHKTRKEYAEKFQPFVNEQPSTLTKQPVKELNHQIIENIFHIQPELNTFEAAALAQSIEDELKRKEDTIIKKFIQEEPQIKPPQANKLDNENKARKSSEDSLDLVSETLARIYTDQMLYHKAIEIYKKLSLKFPDKNHYFAGQITELEKKIN